MKQEMLMLEPTSYRLEGCSFLLLHDIEIRGYNAIKFEEGFRLEYPDQAPSAVASGTRLAEEIKASLAKAADECSVENWDGYGAKAIDSSSYVNAVYFSQLLPVNISIPEIYVDPDGAVTFEWYVGPRQIFSVSMGSNNELVYAGLFGANKTHGPEHLDDELPETILDNIHRVFSG